jgi:hypothetical protein
MTNFDADILSELRDLREVAIRTEKHPKNAVVIWVVVAGDQVLVRSVRGTKGRWYRDLAAGGPATLEFAGRRLGDCQEFRAGLSMMGAKEPVHAETQRASHF